MSAAPTVVWFRQDLRVDDNPALAAAVERGGSVVCVYIHAPREDGDWSPGGAAKWWRHQALADLARTLERHGSRLVIRRGESARELARIVRQCGAAAVLWNRCYEPAVRQRDATVRTQLEKQSVKVATFNAGLLWEPWDIQSGSGGPYQVFSAFYRACIARLAPDRSLAAPRRLAAPPQWPDSLALAELEMEPRIDWAAGLRRFWTPTQAGGQALAKRFMNEALKAYADQRDRPDIVGTSMLSPYLHHGQISVRRLWHTLPDSPGAGAFRRELAWREFAHHLLHHFPHTPRRPLREAYARFPWRSDATKLLAWQKGRTGYPIVDAGLRQLWSIGWMHNRVRMIVASFLVKDLLIPWQDGAGWFWDTLVDADLANNTLGWQWTAGCGADAAPYFRIFNPVSQARRFDPEGAYVRQWVPELAKLPARFVHAPQEAPAEALAAAGVELDSTYPRPIVDHARARDAALAALATISK